jgi:hypothetical protein
MRNLLAEYPAWFKGMNVEALMRLRNQVDERLLTVAIGVGVGIVLAIIGYLLHWISS